mmetsp:Transcript_62670/g.168411  ORF Transcript_62670/g.168411 Transcript_62670/m.168411 type:complete len:211 (-) Transcript_62670:65-697(-)
MVRACALLATSCGTSSTLSRTPAAPTALGRGRRQGAGLAVACALFERSWWDIPSAARIHAAAAEPVAGTDASAKVANLHEVFDGPWALKPAANGSAWVGTTLGRGSPPWAAVAKAHIELARPRASNSGKLRTKATKRGSSSTYAPSPHFTMRQSAVAALTASSSACFSDVSLNTPEALRWATSSSPKSRCARVKPLAVLSVVLAAAACRG